MLLFTWFAWAASGAPPTGAGAAPIHVSAGRLEGSGGTCGGMCERRQFWRQNKPLQLIA